METGTINPPPRLDSTLGMQMPAGAGARPQIFSYDSIGLFVSDMIRWRKASDPEFSVAAASQKLGCSKALVTRVANGSRRLTRDRVPTFAKLLGLTNQEAQYLDRWVLAAGSPPRPSQTPERSVNAKRSRAARPRGPRNHIVSDWLHPYVKETLGLRGFKLDPVVIHRMLGGIASVKRVARSIDFLLREGFFRRTPTGEITLDESYDYTTDEIPDERIRKFHKHALDIARDGLERYSLHERRSDAFMFKVNDENLGKLKELLVRSMDDVVRFRQDHATDDQRLYQVIMHLTPLSEAEGDATKS